MSIEPHQFDPTFPIEIFTLEMEPYIIDKMTDLSDSKSSNIYCFLPYKHISIDRRHQFTYSKDCPECGVNNRQGTELGFVDQSSFHPYKHTKFYPLIEFQPCFTV